MKQESKKYLIKGRVQGVFFRASTREKAIELGVSGWVRNMDDGRVEVYAQAEQAVLNRLHQWLLTGPPMAKVTQIIVVKEVDGKQVVDEAVSNSFCIL